MEDHTREIEKKVKAALQTTMFVVADDNFHGIEMKTLWKLLETCIIPIITYSAETWQLNKTQTKRLNTLLDNSIKRILRIPQDNAFMKNSES